MGYKREAKIYRLAFEAEDMAGLVVQARSIPTGQLMELVRVSSALEGATDGQGLGDLAAVGTLFEGLAGALHSWNLENDNGPVPADLEGLYSQDLDFVLAIVSAWIDAVAGVPEDLGKDSSPTPSTLEAQLPMAS